MEIGKIAICFVILGLAFHNADGCNKAAAAEAVAACKNTMASSLKSTGNDRVKMSRHFETMETCISRAMKGCRGGIVATLRRRLDETFKTAKAGLKSLTGQGGKLPGQGVKPPGQGGKFRGQGGKFRGQGGKVPGQGGKVPRQGGKMPGQGGKLPGQGGKVPGQGGKLPGQGGNVPGQGGKFCGQGGKVPGQGSKVPRQVGKMPGQGGKLPGQGGKLTGQGESNASSTTVVNIVLLIAGTAISLPFL